MTIVLDSPVEVALDNIVDSNIFNLLAALYVPGVITSTKVRSDVLW